MASKNKVKLESNFRKVLDASDLAVAELIRTATDAMEDTAKQRLDKGAGRRGYDLSGADIEKTVDGDEGKIEYPRFYGRFFEYGTATIQAMPFMRPGHRAGRKKIKDAPEIFEKWFKRRARVR